MKVYLAGPINGRTLEGASQWRNEMAAALAGIGCQAVDPLREGGFLPDTDKTDAEIVKRDLEDIDRCNVLLANLLDVRANGEVFVGTSMEIFHAANTGTYVVVLANDLHSPWIRHHADAVVGSELEALKAIQRLQEIETQRHTKAG